MQTGKLTKGNIAIYQTKDNRIEVEIDNKNETIWLNVENIASLFGKDRSNIQRHIKNIYKDNELEQSTTCAFFAQVQKEGSRTVKRQLPYYNLDIILAVGYRVSSKIATNFRRWATDVLRQYLIDGYAINEQCLRNKQEQIDKLKNSINLISRTITTQVKSLTEAQNLVRIMTDFSFGLDLLDDYDNKTLDITGKSIRAAVRIKKEEFQKVIDKMKPEFSSDVFANPKDESFDSSVNQIYQSFNGVDCYPSLEEKAAMLLYFIVKNHSFSDGNKRIGAMCFLYFLNKNNMLYSKEKTLINNATLFSLTLLIAESKPEEKEIIKQVIISVLNRERE